VTSTSAIRSHPTAGYLTFAIEVVLAPMNPDQRLVVYTGEPDWPSHRVLPMLASWGQEGATTGVRRPVAAPDPGVLGHHPTGTGVST
jgi:hypothetical protein